MPQFKRVSKVLKFAAILFMVLLGYRNVNSNSITLRTDDHKLQGCKFIVAKLLPPSDSLINIEFDNDSMQYQLVVFESDSIELTVRKSNRITQSKNLALSCKRYIANIFQLLNKVEQGECFDYEAAAPKKQFKIRTRNNQYDCLNCENVISYHSVNPSYTKIFGEIDLLLTCLGDSRQPAF